MQQPVIGPTVGSLIALNGIGMERVAQDEKWGLQHYPDGTSEDYADLADAYRESCDAMHKSGQGTWADIALEEFYEALAETDPDKLRAELVQAAAVLAAWIEDIDSREYVRVLPTVAEQVAHSFDYIKKNYGG